jgi:hypothetical protein
MCWLESWLPELRSPRQIRLAVALASLADDISGKLSPSAELIRRRSGLRSNHYFVARKQLADYGAIDVQSQGQHRAPVIELRLRPPSTEIPR